MKKSSFLLALVIAALGLVSAAAATIQAKPDTSKVVGNWNIEVYADDQTYELKLVVTETQGQLAGTISESMGAFKDVAINEIFYDGVSFRFSFVSPTPPDGQTRTVKADFQLAENTMEGTIVLPDMDFTADAKGTRSTQ